MAGADLSACFLSFLADLGSSALTAGLALAAGLADSFCFFFSDFGVSEMKFKVDTTKIRGRFHKSWAHGAARIQFWGRRK